MMGYIRIQTHAVESDIFRYVSLRHMREQSLSRHRANTLSPSQVGFAYTKRKYEKPTRNRYKRNRKFI